MVKNLFNEYYSPGNGVLTQSKIKDFLKDREYFYKKHVAGEIEPKITDAMTVGKAVDCWITESKKAFKDKYYVPNKTRTTANDDYECQLTQAMMNEVVGLCESVTSTTVYKDIKKNFESQRILYVEKDIGKYFHVLAGIPDWVKIEKDSCTIVDYKTTTSISPHKYYYTCLDYGYFLQQAMYQKLVKEMYPKVKTFTSWHLVTEKDPDKIYKTGLFYLDQARIEKESGKLEDYIERITNEKKFKRDDVTWLDFEILGQDFTSNL